MGAPVTPRVLVVDDDARNRSLVREWLKAIADVEEAADAPAAYAALDAQPVDLVLLDVMMPGESGISACKNIKARAGPYLPVLLFTALNDQEHRNAGLAAGADDFLSKPVDRQELRMRVQVFLRLRQQDQQIREQLAALGRLDTLKDDLVSLLVHDLRNPLAGLFGWLQVLRAEVPEELRPDVEASLASASRIKETTDDLLQIKALEDGQLHATLVPHQVDDVIARAVALLEGAARVRGTTITVAPSGLSVMAEASLLRRAIENLLANAIKHSPPGSRIDIAARPESSRVSIEVADSGPGVPDDKKGQLFTKFGALDPTLRRTRRGYGLGLYLVQLVADAHQGAAGVRDREGGGAVFFLSIPRGTPG